MNCKPGDTAICTSPNPRFKDRRFLVIGPAPEVEFWLPDGTKHVGCPPNYWILQAIEGTVEAKMLGHPRTRTTAYGAGSDEFLQPVTAEELQ